MIGKLYFSNLIKSNQSFLFFFKRITEKIIPKRFNRIFPCGSTRLAFATRLT